eukprot:a174578_1363.p1 GENE.a174578_1363~~a174578_1363.p1  ORF type:complete len:375 (-),score=127.56 a174578_1363:21-1097(-)
MADTFTVSAFGAPSATEPLVAMPIKRRAPRADDVVIDILWSGVCHSDLHTARNEWRGSVYPVVPGHEIVGRVSAIGSSVSKFAVGDLAGVGCMVDSACERSCSACKCFEEQYCEKEKTSFTYNSPDPVLEGQRTYGGYSKQIVVTEEFVMKIKHDESKLAAVAPLLCAGITMYSPLRHWKVGPGMRVGIVGLGGLGHMAVKLAVAMGADVVLFTSSASKRADGLRLGAKEVVVSTNAEEMAAVPKRSFDFILNSVAASHNLDPFIALLKRDCTLTLVGAPEHPHPSPAVTPLIFGRRSIAGSLIGGTAETQEMLDFCAAHDIVSDIEVIRMDEINTAYERMLRSDVRYRFVIDMSTLA